MSGLYIHVPFCKQKCIYCDFCSYPNQTSRIDEYFECLEKEFLFFKAKTKNLVFDTVFFGGGTPSFVDVCLLKDFLSFLKDEQAIAPGAEITVEGNPDSLTAQKIAVLAACGVNRLSIGLQTADDKMLKFLNRPHTLKQFENAVKIARREGIDNLSADIILGLPYEDGDALKRTLDVVTNAQLKHISAYGLSVERRTVLSGLFKKLTFEKALPDEDTTAGFYDTVKERLENCGFQRYEVSNFAQAGYECRHNVNYWKCGEYLGLGAAAHSYFADARRANVKNLDKYIERIKFGRTAVTSRKRISEEEKMYEFVILGLRMKEGISTIDFAQRFGKDFYTVYGSTVEKLANEGFLILQSDKIFVRQDRFYVLNSILSEF